ncbi:MAG: hypothetical protein JRJ82_03915 [Deltaproteobacteria bacterium]|nr:hypothetical protein [Deltaproteobacteria bacterium]
MRVKALAKGYPCRRHGCKSRFFVLGCMFALLSIWPQPTAGQERPLVARINETIQTRDSTVVVEKVVIYPNERSLYGPGEENHGMPVREEYGKGPVVVLRVDKKPGHPWDIPFADEWILVELFSDGRRLGQRGSGDHGTNRMAFGFNFSVEVDMSVSPDGSVALQKLGEVALEVTVSRIRKVLDLPLHDVPRGSDPIFEDEDVQIWEVQWGRSRKDQYTHLRIRFNSKADSATYFINYEGKDGSRLGASTTESGTEHAKRISKDRLANVGFWKIVTTARRTFSPLKFLPQ